MARKGKSMEEIISALREAEFVLDSETVGLILPASASTLGYRPQRRHVIRW